MIAFFGAFAGFSAFGTVIATFLVSSDALQRLAAGWAAHAVTEAIEDAAKEKEAEGGSAHPDESAVKWAKRRRVILLSTVGVAVVVASVVSACGLVISGMWLRASTRADVASWTWAYMWTGRLLGIEVALITVITVFLMVTAVVFAVKYGQKTEDALKSKAQGSGTEQSRADPQSGTVPGVVGHTDLTH
jgi:hypothetical protein